jgi:glycosyltransferase involved in cell wall biosynthesis
MLSVLMSIFWRESPEFLDVALDSIWRQTRKADQVLLVKDPIGPELEEVLDAYRTRLPFTIVSLPESVGFGEAMRIGVENCTGDLIARMDTDDICLPQRFERQVDFLDNHPDVDLVGSAIAEFGDDPASPHAVRKGPSSHRQIARIAPFRNPINHMTVVFRRAAVLSAGNYCDDAGIEDYRLWARMLMAGSRFHNLDETLVLARTGNGFLKRRGGLVKLRHELSMQAYFWKIGFISAPIYAFNLLARTPVIMVPTGLRKVMYEELLRSKMKSAERAKSEHSSYKVDRG